MSLIFGIMLPFPPKKIRVQYYGAPCMYTCTPFQDPVLLHVPEPGPNTADMVFWHAIARIGLSSKSSSLKTV